MLFELTAMVHFNFINIIHIKINHKIIFIFIFYFLIPFHLFTTLKLNVICSCSFSLFL